jgi:hypothetical protein
MSAHLNIEWLPSWFVNRYRQVREPEAQLRPRLGIEDLRPKTNSMTDEKIPELPQEALEDSEQSLQRMQDFVWGCALVDKALEDIDVLDIATGESRR